MKCKHRIKPPGVDHLIDCGQCIACRIRKREAITLRLLYEAENHEKISFLTLTFDDDHLDPQGSLRRETMPLFNKKLRNRLDKQSRKIVMFYNGEYGDDFGRPHHHGIYFGLDPIQDLQIVDESWGQGRVQLKHAYPESMAYVAGYVIDKLNGDLGAEIYGDRIPPFSYGSKNLGLAAAGRDAEKMARDGYITVNGKKKPIPNLWKKRFQIDLSDRAAQQEEEAWEEWMTFCDNRGIQYYGPEAAIAREAERLQAEKNTQAKINLAKSKRRASGTSL